MRAFEPTTDYHRYKVECLEDIYDEDSRHRLTVSAIGPTSARAIALDQLRNDPDYPAPAPCVLRVEQICDGCDHPSHEGACPHRSYSPEQVFPCGCGERAA